MMVTVIVIACVGTYGFVAGATAAMGRRMWDRWDSEGTFLLGLFWPVSLWWVVGLVVCDRVCKRIDAMARAGKAPRVPRAVAKERRE